MKLLTLAVAIALLGTLFFGCDESKTMMEEITRETPPMTPAEPTPVEPRGDVTVQEAPEASSWSNVGISYTNAANKDGTGQLTIYFEIPDALGEGPHSVTLVYWPEVETNLPNQQLLEEGDYVDEDSAWGTHLLDDRTIATVPLDTDNKIVFGYEKKNPSGGAGFQIYEAISVDEYLFGKNPGAENFEDTEQPEILTTITIE